MKSLVFFRKRGRKQAHLYQPYCIECNKLYQKEHYTNNKSKYITDASTRTKTYQKEKQKYLLKLFKSGCVDCGITDIEVLEFDHCRGIKDMNISQLYSYHSLDRLKAEIGKCELVCANCHRKRTSQRNGFWRSLVEDLKE